MPQLLTDCRRKPLGIDNTDPKRGVLLEADHPGDLFYERDAQSLMMIRAKSEPIICEAEPQPNCGVPAVRASDKRVVDVVEFGLDLESPKSCGKFSLTGDVDAIFVIHAECEEQSIPSFVE